MQNVVSFQSYINKMRADAEIKQRNEEKKNRQEKERAGIASVFGSDPVSQLIGHAIAGAVIERKEKEDADRYMPAYCDPTNEVRGSKYNATQSLSLTELAKRMRQDVKEAMQAGRLPKGLKVSVRTDYFSGGGSIDMRVTAFPDGWSIFKPEVIRYEAENPHAYCGQVEAHCGGMFTPEHKAVMDLLENIHGSYNRDNSDGMSDYFDCHYYGSVNVDWQLRNRIKDRQKLETMEKAQ